MISIRPTKSIYRRPSEGLFDNIRIRLTPTERNIVESGQTKITASRIDERRPTISLAVATIIKAARVEDIVVTP